MTYPSIYDTYSGYPRADQLTELERMYYHRLAQDRAVTHPNIGATSSQVLPHEPSFYSPLNLANLSSRVALNPAEEVRSSIRRPPARPSMMIPPIAEPPLPTHSEHDPIAVNQGISGFYGPLPIDMSGPAVKPPAGPGMPGGGPLEGYSDWSGLHGPAYPQDPYAGFPGPSGTPPVPMRQPPYTQGPYSAGDFTPYYSPDAGGVGGIPGGMTGVPEGGAISASTSGGPGFYDWITDKGSWDPGLTSTEAYGMNIAASLIPTHDQTRVFEGGGSLPGIGKGALIGGSMGSWPGAAIGGVLGLLGAFDTTSPPERSVTTWQRGQSPGFPNVPTASYFQGLI